MKLQYNFCLKKEQTHRGTVTVEFALVLPIALFVTFSLVEFSRVNMIRNSMQNAAYEGARAAIVRGGTAFAAKEKALSVLETISVNNPEIRVTPAKITNQTPTVQVEISVPLGENMWIAPKFFDKQTMVKSFLLTRETSQGGY